MVYDLIIIGAGAAGIVASIETTKKGLNVCIIDQNNSVGRKLSITGGGRCNLTSTVHISEFENYIPRNYMFLQSCFSQFTNKDLISYFSMLGIETKTEGDKVYLKSDDGQKLIKVLGEKINEKTTIKLNTKITDIIIEDNNIIYIKADNEILKAKEYLIATGGLSYPNLGSDGSIFDILSSKNIFSIEKLFPTLVPINFKNNTLGKLSGISLEAAISVELGKKRKSLLGELLFTHKGISGPLALNFSSYLVDLEKSSYNVYIDFLPKRTKESLLNEFKQVKGKEKINTVINNMLPKNLVKTIFDEDIIDFSNLSKKGIDEIINKIKKYKVEIDSFEGYNKAIVTRGGISTKEINPKTMKSKKIKNLYFAGEVIDVDGFTGGYNLQIAFSTGYVAAKNIGGIK